MTRLSLIFSNMESYQSWVDKGLNMFSDSDLMTWSISSIGAIVNSSIMNGFPDRIFAPRNSMKRGEAVVVSYRENLLNKSSDQLSEILLMEPLVAGNARILRDGRPPQLLTLRQ